MNRTGISLDNGKMVMVLLIQCNRRSNTRCGGINICGTRPPPLPPLAAQTVWCPASSRGAVSNNYLFITYFARCNERAWDQCITFIDMFLFPTNKLVSSASKWTSEWSSILCIGFLSFHLTVSCSNQKWTMKRRWQGRLVWYKIVSWWRKEFFVNYIH